MLVFTCILSTCVPVDYFLILVYMYSLQNYLVIHVHIFLETGVHVLPTKLLSYTHVHVHVFLDTGVHVLPTKLLSY